MEIDSIDNLFEIIVSLEFYQTDLEIQTQTYISPLEDIRQSIKQQNYA